MGTIKPIRTRANKVGGSIKSSARIDSAGTAPLAILVFWSIIGIVEERRDDNNEQENRKK